MLYLRGCVLFHRSPLFRSSFFIFSLSSPICIQIRLIPPPPSCHLYVSSMVILQKARETLCSQPLCLLRHCALQQPKSPVLNTASTAPVPAWSSWEGAAQGPLQTCRELKSLCKFKWCQCRVQVCLREKVIISVSETTPHFCCLTFALSLS